MWDFPLAGTLWDFRLADTLQSPQAETPAPAPYRTFLTHPKNVKLAADTTPIYYTLSSYR